MVARLLHVRTGRQAHEIVILIASIIVGVVGAVLPEDVSNAIAHVMHGWVIHTYYAGLAAFSVLTLCGILYRKIEGLLVERVGLTVVALYYAVFAVCIISYAGLAGAMGALLPVAYTIGNSARIWQIRTDLSLLKDYLADHPDDDFLR